MTRPPPTQEAVARIHALGEKAILQFFDEVPTEALRALVRFLPPAPGFRTDSTAGIQQRKRALARKLATKASAPSPAGDRDYRALYIVWRCWASEHIGEPGAIDTLLDSIEEAEDEPKPVPDQKSSATNGAIAAVFSTLEDWATANRCTREQIERLFIFSPFSATEEIQGLIRGSKASGDVDRDATIAALPQRLRQDEEEIRGVKSKLDSLSANLADTTAKTNEFGKAITVVEGTTRMLAARESELRALHEEQSRVIETIVSTLREHDVFNNKTRQQYEQLSTELKSIADKLGRLASEVPKQEAIDAVVARLAAVEKTPASDAETHARLLAKLSNDISDLAARVENLSARPLGGEQFDTFAVRLATLESAYGSFSSLRLTGAAATATPNGLTRLSVDKLGPANEAPSRTFESVAGLRDAFSSALQSLGLKNTAAKVFAMEIAAASLAGQIVFFKGAFATEAARLCARVASAGRSYRSAIPIGLNDGELLRSALDGVLGHAEEYVAAVVVEGINRSALEVFADVLSDFVEPLSHFKTPSPSAAFVYATLIQGSASLSIEPHYLERGPIFDLDHFDWRARRPEPVEPLLGVLPLRVQREARAQIDASTINQEEVLRLSRKFLRKRNPQMERILVGAYTALNLMHDLREGPTALQSLAFGWLAPLWISLGVTREDADSELDGGKCDSNPPRADPRIASILATGGFGASESMEAK